MQYSAYLMPKNRISVTLERKIKKVTISFLSTAYFDSPYLVQVIQSKQTPFLLPSSQVTSRSCSRRGTCSPTSSTCHMTGWSSSAWRRRTSTGPGLACSATTGWWTTRITPTSSSSKIKSRSAMTSSLGGGSGGSGVSNLGGPNFPIVGQVTLHSGGNRQSHTVTFTLWTRNELEPFYLYGGEDQLTQV